jgi:hypothetical protein
MPGDLASMKWRMFRVLSITLTCLLFTGLAGEGRGEELTEAQKKALFLRAREDIRPVPRSNPTPRPTPRAAPKPTPRPKATPKPEPPAHKPPQPEEDDFIPLEKERKPEPVTRKAKPVPTPKPTPKATPKATRKATPKPRRGDARSAPITIEKSGASGEQGFAPPPRQGGWFKRYRYLTPEVRRAIDRARVRTGRWRYIVVHNSATNQGNAKIFDRYHRNVRKMPNGLAYHFVIGNGNASGDGEIEIGQRWTRQINGGHVASDYLNNIALGICLVGDFDRRVPTRAQLGALQELTDYLRKRVGRSKGKLAAVRGHKQINPRPTTCPGKRFNLKWLNSRFRD